MTAQPTYGSYETSAFKPYVREEFIQPLFYDNPCNMLLRTLTPSLQLEDFSYVDINLRKNVEVDENESMDLVDSSDETEDISEDTNPEIVTEKVPVLTGSQVMATHKIRKGHCKHGRRNRGHNCLACFVDGVGGRGCCEHRTNKHLCHTCNPDKQALRKGYCKHNRRHHGYNCRQCFDDETGGAGCCEHSSSRSSCRTCNPHKSTFKPSKASSDRRCEHGKIQNGWNCRDCFEEGGGGGCCKHVDDISQCKSCIPRKDDTSIKCPHDKPRNGYNCRMCYGEKNGRGKGCCQHSCNKHQCNVCKKTKKLKT